MDVIYLLDESASFGKNQFKNVKRVIQQTTTLLLNQTSHLNMSFVEFGHRINVHQTFDSPKHFLKALAGAHSTDSAATKISSAFRASADKLLKVTSNMNKIIVFFSDGVPKPAKLYGGSNIVEQVNRNRILGLKRIIFVCPTQNNSKQNPNQNFFNKLGAPFYEKSRDFLLFDLKNTKQQNKQAFILKETIMEPSSHAPTLSPTVQPTFYPTAGPTELSTTVPTIGPTELSTNGPTTGPTKTPNSAPTAEQEDKTLSLGFFISIPFVLLFLFLCLYKIHERKRRKRFLEKHGLNDEEDNEENDEEDNEEENDEQLNNDE